jgi:exodeoxyribonuclease-3
VQIVTWNVNSLKARMERVEAWLDEHRPDVLCLQETKMADDALPASAFEALGYETVHAGQGRWNGVAIVSRVGLDDITVGFDDGDEPDVEARLVWATCGGVRVASVYVPNGREVDHDHFRYKLKWLARLRATLDARADPADLVCVCGDFNIAPTDDDVWDRSAFEGSTHVTPREREALASLEEWGLVDTFARQPRQDVHFSYWDYRGGAFHKNEGMRIDLVMASEPLADRATSVAVDRNERKPTGNAAGGKPSDHAPLVASFDL